MEKKLQEFGFGECFEWTWESEGSVAVFKSSKDVRFNPGFSVGTVAVRGSQPLEKGLHHYFEIQMSTEVYGTDMMIGIGTESVDLKKHSHSFVSFLGLDAESWGLSYNGNLQHGGVSKNYTRPFGQHSIIGIHVDLWTGTIEFYLNRKPLGTAYRNILTTKAIYPMISSTAARSGMTLKYCRSFGHSLQLQCLLALGRCTFWPENTSVFKCHDLPPGLHGWVKNNFWWVTCNEINRRSPYYINKEMELKKSQALRRKVGDNEKNEEKVSSVDNKRLRLRSLGGSLEEE